MPYPSPVLTKRNGFEPGTLDFTGPKVLSVLCLEVKVRELKGCSQKITEAVGTAPVIVASLIRPRSSKAVRYLNCKESHVLLLTSPSIKKTAFPVFASASQ